MAVKILLVDDNLTFIAAVRQFLDRLPGIQIVGHAHDGTTALALVRAHRPALILLDIAMPGMNGLDLARAVRQESQAPAIIFLSMHDHEEYRSAARELDAGFVSKSDFVAELLPRIKTLSEAGHCIPCGTLTETPPLAL